MQGSDQLTWKERRPGIADGIVKIPADLTLEVECASSVSLLAGLTVERDLSKSQRSVSLLPAMFKAESD